MSTLTPCDFAVVIPVFETAPTYLSACVDSVTVAAREYGSASVEIVIIDDGSSPDFSESYFRIARQFRNGRHKIAFHRLERNVGIAGARNFGIWASNSEWLILVDSDDLIRPDALLLIRPALRADTVLAYTAHQKVTEDLVETIETRHKIRYQRLLLENVGTLQDPFLHYTFLIHVNVINRQAYEVVGGLDCRIQYGDEVDFHLRLTEGFNSSHCYAYIDQVLYKYRQNSSGICANPAKYAELITSIESILLSHYRRRGGTASNCRRRGKEPDGAVGYDYVS